MASLSSTMITLPPIPVPTTLLPGFFSGHTHLPGAKLCTAPPKALYHSPEGSAISSSSVCLRRTERHARPVLAVAETLVGDVGPVSGDLELQPASEELSSLKSESDLLKKRAKRAELRRKRLVRKRRLRKKGRWPPSKLAKNKNV